MSVINRFLSPQFVGRNNENEAVGKLTAKQALSSVKPKKKALLDVGNTIGQQKHVYSEGKKAAGKWTEETNFSELKMKKDFTCSPVLSTSEGNSVIDDHEWSSCENFKSDEMDGFLPNFQLTKQQLNSYALDWDIKPQANTLQLLEIKCAKIEEPESPDMWSSFDIDCELAFPMHQTSLIY